MLDVVTTANYNPRILTNMTFWQSPEWLARTDSIYPLDPAHGDPDFMPWWKEAWTLFRRRSGYDVIHTMGIRESFAFAFLCWMTGRPSRQIMTEVFIDAPRPQNPWWQIKTFFYRMLARRCLGMITNSTAEIDTNAQRFNLPRERFRFVQLCTTISAPTYEARPDSYLFCAGRTLRDYATLTEVMKASDQLWHVVAGHHDLRNMDLPARITVHREIARDTYLDLLRGARIVVLPLLPTERSTGQVVLLEAMAYGKPVITTRAPGTEDILRHGENGFLVGPGDAAGIKTLLGHLRQDPETGERIGRQALRDIQQYHTTAMHAEARLHAIRELWRIAGN